ncbi:MAG: hypothetical protein IT270_16810 [Saprospiraceae bacterium]|nr:hypothetical protein [Saprospiraceae bacterium]
MKNLLFPLALLVFVFAPGSCKDTENICPNGQTATLKDMTGLDGCGFVIQLPDGTLLEPINLNEFVTAPVDGQSVQVEYDTVFANISFCMTGNMVQITCLE